MLLDLPGTPSEADKIVNCKKYLLYNDCFMGLLYKKSDIGLRTRKAYQDTISDKLYFTDNEVIKNTDNPIAYIFTQGVDSEWNADKETGLIFTADGDLEKFTGIMVDGKLIDSLNYDTKSGSTIITLKLDYLKTLKIGKHTITFVYTDGEISTDFKIKDVDHISSVTKSPDTNAVIKNSTKPHSKTVLILIAIFVIVLCGAAGAFIYYRKTRR
ncbi:MAG: hypothetical protein WCR45_12560 [Bacteroidaceae bacterium]